MRAYLPACCVRAVRRNLSGLTAFRLSALTIPVRLAQIGEVTPTAFGLACGMQCKARTVHTQRDGLRDERGLASLRCGPADDRVVLGQVQASVGMTERREVLDARTHRVGELGHRQI